MSEAEKPKVAMRTVAAADDGVRLDRWFKQHYPSVSHGALEKMLRKGQIRVDGGRVKANRRVAAGEAVRIPPTVHDGPSGPSSKPAPRFSQSDHDFVAGLVIHEDDDILALNKPFGLAVQGGTNTNRHIDGMLASFERQGERPRLVHRLDRDTGGLLVLAKSRAAAAALSGAFQRHEISKTYWALTVAAPSPREGQIDMPIAKRTIATAAGEQERVAPTRDATAKKAITDFQTMETTSAGPAFVALRPVTGRTHQLRVHCAAIEAPIVGDGKYGGPGARIDGIARDLHLFCREMTFVHPQTNRKITLRAPLTGHMLKTWRFLGFDDDVRVDWSTDAN